MTLPPGKKVFNLRQSIDSANFYTYEAKFIPDRAEDNTMPQNKRATAFTHVAGKGQVLLIVSQERPNEYNLLAERLRQHGLEVVVRGDGPAFLQPGRVADLRHRRAGRRAPRDQR